MRTHYRPLDDGNCQHKRDLYDARMAARRRSLSPTSTVTIWLNFNNVDVVTSEEVPGVKTCTLKIRLNGHVGNIISEWVSSFLTVHQHTLGYLGRPTLVGKAFSPMKFFFFFFLFYQFTVLSSRSEDSHQMYFGGSAVAKAPTIGIGISPIPPLIFAGGSKSTKFCVVWNFSQVWAARVCKCMKMRQDIWILKQKCNVAIIALWSGQVWWSWVHAPLRKLCQFWPTP